MLSNNKPADPFSKNSSGPFLQLLEIINVLQKEVWDHKSKRETHTVETHIYRLRKKIEKKFRDKFFIKSLKDGYKLNA